MPTPQEALEQIKKLSQNLTLRQKVVAASVVALAFAVFGVIFFIANRPVYKPLYSDLSPQDAAEITAWLKKESVPYQLYNDGTAIRVPEEKVYDVRLSLAGAGLPRGSVGFEIFDLTNLGVTDFVQHVNYQRALQGELEKTISRFPQIRSVRVLLALPQESLFTSEKKEPTASVVLQLKPGEELSRNQIKGIVHLVASAVPRLKKENVSVVDTDGGVLYDSKDQENDQSLMTNTQLAYQKKLEDYYRHKIQSMLEDVLGPNKAVVRVATDVDFDQVQTSEDRYDPDQTAVRSEQKISEIDTSQENAGGVAGVKGGLADKLQGNVTGPAATNTGAGGAPPALIRQKTQDTSNYEITRIQRQINASIGKLKKISVAVMVDGSYLPKGKELVYTPRSQEELANLDRIVKAAIGFDPKRGDEVSVVNVPFKAQQPEGKAPSKLFELASYFATPFMNIILAVLFIVFVLRPLFNRYVLKPRGKEEAGAVPSGARTGEGETGEGEFEFPPPPVIHPIPDARERLREMANAYPERAAALVKIWLREKAEAGGTKNA
ncbi:MAG: flagellar basal-body MS-ring/collar protein FliF [Dissulfurimicrobium hydrothermale]|uniref:flagellar basal-body MS-ring/collar protein FliF n=1 Tax=Dissulfurimicrobium hydrothermale TaxID=1750598 RepID=UPI003C720692